MGCHDDGDTTSTFLFDDVVHEPSTVDVEAGRRLIEEEHLCLTREHLCELCSLLLTAREVAQWQVGLRVDARSTHRLLHDPSVVVVRATEESE